MLSRRADLVALCALILAVASFAVTLRPYLSVAAAGPNAPGGPEATTALPGTLNYQGVLRSTGGALLNGTYAMTFRLYADPTGGSPLFSQTISGVVVRDGLFNVVLGDGTPIPTSVFSDAPRYIGVQVGPDPEMVPRQRLHPVPWAQQATYALTATTLVNGASVYGGLNVAGILSLPGLVNLGQDEGGSGTRSISFGRNTGDEVNAGKIIYRPSWNPDTLAIVGAGAPPNRKVILFDQLQLSNWYDGDRYIKLTTAGGNSFRTGVKLFAWQDNYGFTIEHDERNVDGHNAGLNILKNNLNTSTSLMFVDWNSGNVGIGKTNPGYKLDVSGKVRASSGFNGKCGDFSDPGAVGLNINVTCNQDVAESFATTEQTEPGDLVVLLPESRAHPTVRLSRGAYDSGLVGVVSTNPGLVFDRGETYLAGENSQLITADKTVVAMIGRVPVKVSLENGPIAVGDPLTSSSTPGVAMKATQAGQILGYAMQSSDEAASGKLLAWLQLGHYLPPQLMATLNEGASAPQTVEALKAQNETLTQQVSAMRAENAALDARLTALERGNAAAGLPQWAVALGLVMMGLVVTQGFRARAGR